MICFVLATKAGPSSYFIEQVYHMTRTQNPFSYSVSRRGNKSLFYHFMRPSPIARVHLCSPHTNDSPLYLHLPSHLRNTTICQSLGRNWRAISAAKHLVKRLLWSWCDARFVSLGVYVLFFLCPFSCVTKPRYLLYLSTFHIICSYVMYS